MKQLIILLLIPVLSVSQEVDKRLKYGLTLGGGLVWASDDPYYTSEGYDRYMLNNLGYFGLRVHKPYSRVFGFGGELLFQSNVIGYRKVNPQVKSLCLSGDCDQNAYFIHRYEAMALSVNLYTTIHSGWGYASPYLRLGIRPNVTLHGSYDYNR